MTVWNNNTVRELERDSIRSFVHASSAHLVGHVLDYGCGKEPYRPIVEAAGGAYTGFDRVDLPSNVSEVNLGPNDVLDLEWDAILCTQVLQFVPDPEVLLGRFHDSLVPGGVLLLTYATCWDEVEPADLHRHTRQGINWLLCRVGLSPVYHERRAEIALGGFTFPLGGAVIAERSSGWR